MKTEIPYNARGAETAHTPTPWRAEGGAVFTSTHRMIIGEEPLNWATTLEVEDAAFVVRAVNAHAALVAALATARDALAIASNVIAEHLDQSDEETADFENLSAASTQVADACRLLTSLVTH